MMRCLHVTDYKAIITLHVEQNTTALVLLSYDLMNVKHLR